MLPNRPASAWREFAFVHDELRSAIEPGPHLRDTPDQWNTIAEALAERPRRRRAQLADYFEY